ncbi:Y-family DNA polymerase [Methyloligella solikamskensis]|uniref:DNA-directed DNA polymerase n=1 Tax=Methyloligella solikamskensis TaxID=1177756 RepID=A0ABW3J9H1_9HYPH
MRMISVWLPHWPIERLKRELTRSAAPQAERQHQIETIERHPFALVGSEGQKLLITALNAPAERAGLSEGQALTDARAIYPQLLTAPATLERDAEALLALARWAERFSPWRNTDGTDGLWLDATGIAHLFGGEQALLQSMERAFVRLGLTVHLAIADSLGTAWACARFGREPLSVVPPGKQETALSALPVEGLRLSDDAARLLRRLGLKRIGQLYDLPRTSLKRRFASREIADAVLRRLDQALGRHDERAIPLLKDPPQTAHLSFPEPLITHEGIVAALATLADELCGNLADAHLGMRRVAFRLTRADGGASIVRAGFSAPCREAHHLCDLLEKKLEGLDLGFGIDTLHLTAFALESLTPHQTALTKDTGRAALAPLADRLTNRLGPRAVRRLEPRQSHLPERAQRARSLSAKPVPNKPIPKVQEVLRVLKAKPPRPALFLRKPEPLQVLAEIPEGPPARFTWRRVTRRIVKAEGPERIAPEWWRLQLPKTRDYYRVEDEDGRRYWVYREGLYQESEDGDPAWYLQGVFQ